MIDVASRQIDMRIFFSFSNLAVFRLIVVEKIFLVRVLLTAKFLRRFFIGSFEKSSMLFV